MALNTEDSWNVYTKQYGAAPKNATQLQQFSKTSPNIQILTFKEAREIFNSHNTSNQKNAESKDFENKENMQTLSEEIQRETKNLDNYEINFEKSYNECVENIEKEFESIYDALKKRETDLKKWRKQEYDEGRNKIKSAKNTLQTQNSNSISKMNDFSIMRFTQRSLQIQNVLNIIFQLGQTYQQNMNNKQFISLQINKNLAKRIVKTKPVKHYQVNHYQVNQYKNQNQNRAYNSNVSGIKGFDIGNNEKYGNVSTLTQNTNALPSNFWESESDTDSEKDRLETQEQIVNRWKTQQSNIVPAQSGREESTKGKKTHHSRVRSMYDDSSEDSDDHGQDKNDEFEKYIPPSNTSNNRPYIPQKKVQKTDETWIIIKENKKFEYDTQWFKVPKMRNGKANGAQMKIFMQKSGLNKDALKRIWKLSDLDRDGKMGNEEALLCMYLMEKAKNGEKLPDKLPNNYIPPSFRGKARPKTPPKRKQPKMNKAKPLPNMNLGNKPKSPKPLPNSTSVSQKTDLANINNVKPKQAKTAVNSNKSLKPKSVNPDNVDESK